MVTPFIAVFWQTAIARLSPATTNKFGEAGPFAVTSFECKIIRSDTIIEHRALYIVKSHDQLNEIGPKFKGFQPAMKVAPFSGVTWF